MALCIPARMAERSEMRLHLGCGNQYREGWINVDRSRFVKCDLYFDLTMWPWPWADNSVDEIWCDQLLEHLTNTPRAIEEVNRILKPGGVFHGLVPYSGSLSAFVDPTHRVFFTERSFIYWDKNRPKDTQGYGFEFSKVEVSLVANSNTRLARLRNLIPFRGLLKWFLWNMYDNVSFRLTK